MNHPPIAHRCNPNNNVGRTAAIAAASALASASSSSSSSKPHRPTSLKQFPGKLHDLLTYAQQNGLDDVLSWVHNGSAFMVHDQQQLLKILPIFFGQTKFRSFQRQLNMWKFERVLVGPYKGAFMHPFFVQGNKALCASMTRNPTISSSSSVATINHFKTNDNPLLGQSDGLGGDGRNDTNQFILGRQHDILDRSRLSPQQHLTWAEYTRRQVLMKGIESVDLKEKQTTTSPPPTSGSYLPNCKRTPGATRAKLSSTISHHRLSRSEQEDNWSLLSECLERLMSSSDRNLEPRPFDDVTLPSDEVVVRLQDIAMLVDMLPPGMGQPATPEQVEDLFKEMSSGLE